MKASEFGLDTPSAFARATVYQPPDSLLRVVQFRGGVLTYDRDDELVLSMCLTANHRLTYAFGRTSVSVVPMIGQFGLMTPSELFRINLSGDCLVLQMVLPCSLLSSWISEDHGIDGSRVDIAHGHALDDPVVSQLLWSARVGGLADEQTNLRSVATHLVSRFATGSRVTLTFRGGLTTYSLRRVIDYVDANAANAITVNDLAREIAMSPYHFAHQFTRSTGRSPYRFIIERRLSRAIDLLRDPRLTIGEIAAKCGFAHISHLSRHLHRVLGQSPTRMRHAINMSGEHMDANGMPIAWRL